MCSQIIKNKPVQRVLLFASLIWPATPYALETLSDQEMGKVSGRDGVTISLQVPETESITAEQIRWELDNGTAEQNHIVIGGTAEDTSQFSIQAIGADGAVATEALDFALAIDAFTNDQSRPGLALDATWNRMRMQMDDLTVTDTGRSFGTMALDTAGRFAIVGDGGLFSHENDQARLTLNVGNVDVTGGTGSRVNPTNWAINDPGDLFFRMTDGGTEAILHNFAFLFDMPGTVGIDEDGFVMQSTDTTDFNLTFDLYANAVGQDFKFLPYEPIDGVNTDSIPMLLFGWRGGLENLDLRLRPEGTWLDTGVHTQGLTASLKFDLASDFQFVIGEAGDDRSYLEFTDPVSLTAADGSALNRNDVEFGYLTLDTVSAGHDTVPNICYGGGNPYGGTAAGCTTSTGDILPVQSIDLPASDTGLALVARDWGLHAYASKVQYRDGVTSDNDVDDGWALIYTLGDISGNWYLYPQAGGGTDAETDPGFTMDIATAIQTIGGADPDTGRPLRQRWEDGTNLMIGDTNFFDGKNDVPPVLTGHPAESYSQGMAIGLMGSDLLFVADDMGVALTQPQGLGLSSDAVRLQLRGIFGGGDIPRMTHPVYGSYVDVNLEFDKFQFNLFPALFDGSYINFGGFFSLANLDNGFSGNAAGDETDDGSYISLAEPNFNKLDVDVRLADITGDIEIPLSVVGDGGKIDLISASGTQGEAGFEGPKLRIETNMEVGQAATKPGGGAGDPLEIGRIEFGDKDLGSMIIPAAKIYTSLTLEQQ